MGQSQGGMAQMAKITLFDLIPDKIHKEMESKGVWDYSIYSPLGFDDPAEVHIKIILCNKRMKRGTEIELRLPLTTNEWSLKKFKPHPKTVITKHNPDRRKDH
jgi:hypothetical protein